MFGKGFWESPNVLAADLKSCCQTLLRLELRASCRGATASRWAQRREGARREPASRQQSADQKRLFYSTARPTVAREFPHRFQVRNRLARKGVSHIYPGRTRRANLHRFFETCRPYRNPTQPSAQAPSRPLGHESLAAVDRNALTADVGRCLRTQEGGDLADILLAFSDASQGNRRNERGGFLRVVVDPPK